MQNRLQRKNRSDLSETDAQYNNWDSEQVESMPLHGWKELKTSTTTGMAELVNTVRWNVIQRH